MAQVFYPTASGIIDAALRTIGVYDSEGTSGATTDITTNALATLNYIVTAWQADGMQVWCQKLGSYTLSAANSYTIGASGATITAARPLAITQAWLRDTATTPVDTPLNIVSREEFNLLSVKTTSGIPNQLYYDPEYDRDASNSGANAKGKIWIWPQPDSTVVTNYDLYFVYTRPIQDFNATTDTLDFPQYWFNAVRLALADELAFEYGVPVEIHDRLHKRAVEAKKAAMDFDVDPAPVFFQPSDRYS